MPAQTQTHSLQHPNHAVAWAADCGAGRSVALKTLHDIGSSGAEMPRRNEVLLWLGQPGPAWSSDWTAWLPFLTGHERSRLHRLRFAEDKWSYAASHAALRLLLAPLLGEAPDEIDIVPSRKGKPELSRSRYGAAMRDLHFNISHTRGMAAVAIAGCPIGVDVERVRPLAGMRELVVDLMAPEALEAFDELGDDEARMRLFFRYWTLSEAFIKATGEGLDQGLATFAFTARGTPGMTRVTPGWGGAGRWRFGHA